jgi:hypothetical protein
MMRLESALEKATLRLEGASQDMNLQGVRDDIARLRDQVGKKPGAVTIFVIALIAALIGAGVAFATAAIVDRLDRIGDLIEARNARQDPAVTARSPDTGKPYDDHNRQTLELAEKLAALKKRPPPA